MSIEDGPGDTLSPSEGLDSDEVRNDDGDEVVDPPEGWSGADRFGTTQREEQEGESLGQRLAEEEPDVAPPEPLERPVAAMPDDELTEDIVDEVYDGGGDTAVYDGGGDTAVYDGGGDTAVYDGGRDTAVVDGGRKHAELVEGVIVEDSRVDRGQIDGSPEDGESLFPVVE
ncbi:MULTISPECIES: hypothetical protein [unclassified Rhodococcus (in: high G+C Gram-positive bacteria)]|uniref:hypothetical protein n=1 Tax=unclassified Rhodococcus (in: high G+C Gram-positive bacteria) TaxID=192944 RepID=UPI00094B34DA|nr:hypothetical protein [Rhodococcus sp. M8]OLL19123.1 hypothetical protein BKE56_003385 [Rhodococcus sp. M8]QPG47812.1 hypothetical protein ISO16_12985 [Rhodococcus sp. M8]